MGSLHDRVVFDACLLLRLCICTQHRVRTDIDRRMSMGGIRHKPTAIGMCLAGRSVAGGKSIVCKPKCGHDDRSQDRSE